MILLAAVAAIIAFALTPPLTALMRKLAIIDTPNNRSSHVVATPRGGGVTLIASTLACILAGSAGGAVQTSHISATVLVFGVFYGALGLCDDVLTLGSKLRLATQLLLAIAATLILAQIVGGSVATSALVLIVCVMGITAFVNAFNFMDGINGISGLHGTLSGTYFGWQAWISGDLALAAVAAVLAGACIGFLPFNLIRAKIFLGDVGSYFLGATLALLAACLWLTGISALAATAPLILYIADTGWTLAKRAQAKKPLAQAHREHAYQRLADRFGHARSAAFSAGCSLAIVAIASASSEASAAQYAWCAAVAAFYIASSEHFGRATVGASKP